MSNGTFAVSRRVWRHPAFRKEPFTEREAWIWMVGEASWKRRVTRAGDLVVPLERGELVASSRFCAEAWSWTDSKVRRFVQRLQKLEMISSKTDAGVTVITICNYDDYQGSDAATDAGPTQDRRRTDANENKEEIQREERGKEEDSSSVPVPANDVSEAVSSYNLAASRAGWPQVQKLNPNRSKQLRARLAECGGLEGWEVALRKAFDSDFLSGRSGRWQGFGFDWLVKSGNFTKIMEGNYDKRSDTSPRGRDTGGGMAEAFGAVAARRSAAAGRNGGNRGGSF